MKRLVLAAAGALVTAGCGVHDPYNDATTQTPPQTATHGARRLPSNPAAAGRPAAAAEQAVRRFAQIYVNWTFDTLGDQRRMLAPLAVGDLRRRMLADAHDADLDTGRRVSEAKNTGSVEAVVVRGQPPVIVVTREQATLAPGQQSDPGWLIYLADVRRVGDRYLVSQFTPVSP